MACLLRLIVSQRHERGILHRVVAQLRGVDRMSSGAMPVDPSSANRAEPQPAGPRQMAHVREWGCRFIVPIPEVTLYE